MIAMIGAFFAKLVVLAVSAKWLVVTVGGVLLRLSTALLRVGR